MHKFIAFLSIGLMFASTVSAEVDAQAFKVVSDIQRGVNNNNQIKTLRVAGDAAIGDDMTLGGDLMVSGGIGAAGAALIGGDLGLVGDLGVAGAAKITGQLESGSFFAPSAQLTDVLNVGTNVIIGGSAFIGNMLFSDFLDVPVGETNSLYLGTTTAVNVVLAADGKETHVDGSLNVDEAATIGGDLALNGSRIAVTSNLVAVAGAVTATMTNAPALVSAAAPKWVVVEIDGDDYVVPAFKIQP